MAATLEAVPSTKTVEKLTEKSDAEAARELVRMAKEQGLSLTGPDGLLKHVHQERDRDRPGRGIDRAPRL